MLIRGLSFVKTLSSHLLDQASGKMCCVSCGFPGCDVICERNEVPEPPKPQLQYFLLHSMFKSMLGAFLFASANVQYSMLAFLKILLAPFNGNELNTNTSISPKDDLETWRYEFFFAHGTQVTCV